MNRRTFLRASVAASTAALCNRTISAAFNIGRSSKITFVTIQTANGKRLTPVAPNAYAPYRGYDVREPVLRIRTADGLEGVGRLWGKPEVVKKLVGLDPFAMFDWDGDVVRGPAEAHAKYLDELAGCDVALFDLLGKSMKKPVQELLGPRVRDAVEVYDSSLYMEDLLKPNERENLAYIGKSPPPEEPAEWVARKSKWILEQPGGIRILKIKLGRVKWMGDMRKAVERDIAVVKAIRKAVGPHVVLFVDGNDGYDKEPLAAAEFAIATKDENVYAMEEMFSEKKLEQLREVKRRMRDANVITKIADGENDRDGISDALCAERFKTPCCEEPLFDINQPDMNQNGYLRMAAIAKRSDARRMKMSPHNFGSKFGFWSMIHSGLVTRNWEFCETDDSEFPALKPEGIVVEKGVAKLTGMPGVGVVLDESKLDKPTVTFEA